MVDYGFEVLGVAAEQKSADSLIDVFAVRSRNTDTGERVSHRARHVVIAVGGKPKLPRHFPRGPRIMHSSAYCTSLPNPPNDRFAPYKIGVIGSGQSAAENFTTCNADIPIRKRRWL